MMKIENEVQAEARRFYEKARTWDPAEMIRLAQRAETQEEKMFYVRIADMNLQRAQKEVIAKNLF